MANKNRFTYFTDDYPVVTSDSCYEDQNENYTGPSIERLAEYEATGLMPAEVAALKQQLKHAETKLRYFQSRAEFFREVAEVGNKFISVEGFKAFRGTMRITPKAAVPAYDLHGDWLYRPETGCWYGKGSSFPEDICTIAEVGTKKLIEWKSDLICGGFAEEWAYVCPECGCKISDKSGLGLGEYARSNQRLNLCPNCGSITKKGTNI